MQTKSLAEGNHNGCAGDGEDDGTPMFLDQEEYPTTTECSEGLSERDRQVARAVLRHYLALNPRPHSNNCSTGNGPLGCIDTTARSSNGSSSLLLNSQPQMTCLADAHIASQGLRDLVRELQNPTDQASIGHVDLVRSVQHQTERIAVALWPLLNEGSGGWSRLLELLDPIIALYQETQSAGPTQSSTSSSSLRRELGIVVESVLERLLCHSICVLVERCDPTHLDDDHDENQPVNISQECSRLVDLIAKVGCLSSLLVAKLGQAVVLKLCDFWSFSSDLTQPMTMDFGFTHVSIQAPPSFECMFYLLRLTDISLQYTSRNGSPTPSFIGLLLDRIRGPCMVAIAKSRSCPFRLTWDEDLGNDDEDGNTSLNGRQQVMRADDEDDSKMGNEDDPTTGMDGIFDENGQQPASEMWSSSLSSPPVSATPLDPCDPSTAPTTVELPNGIPLCILHYTYQLCLFAERLSV